MMVELGALLDGVLVVVFGDVSEATAYTHNTVLAAHKDLLHLAAEHVSISTGQFHNGHKDSQKLHQCLQFHFVE